MTPASQLLEKASAEETKIEQFKGELAAIEGKKTEREHRVAELTAKRNKAKADLEESLKRNDEVRKDAVSLTDFQKKELSEVEARQAAIIQQFNSDTAQLNKELAELRTRRETEVGRATKWNAEEARIENEYKTKLADYTNKKDAYDKEKADYDKASFIRRKLMKEPVSPGVPPEREANSVLKPTAVAEIDAQIKTKEAELLAVNSKRRERVAQVDADARRIREDYDRRASSQRQKSDVNREQLAAAQTALAAQLDAEEKQIDVELAPALKKIDDIRAQIDTATKSAEGFYEAREAAIRKTQVHRIATTVEIVRGLFKGERPHSIRASAKERGDLLTDQISMVRIWVYPVLAFIVAFLPTLMVEIGFSTVFKPEEKRPSYRMGFMGRRLHWLYKRAGRHKILRAERMANEATAQIIARDNALAAKETELEAARESIAVTEAKYAQQAQSSETEWTTKLAAMADSLNRTVVEKDSIRDLQKSEVERQIQARQNAWTDRLNQMRQELDDQRTASETERNALMQEQHKRLMEVTEDAKNQVIQIRRQMADAEMAAVEKCAKLAHDLKEAQHARDEAESQLKHQADSLSLKLNQVEEEGTRQLDKATRQEKHRFERQQMEFDKTLRQREEDFQHKLNQREQEMALALDARVIEEKNKIEQAARVREAEMEREVEERIRELKTRWNQEVEQREEAAQVRLKQREQQLLGQSEDRLRTTTSQAEEQLRRRESDLERQLDAKAREAETRLSQELQQKELAFQAKLKQREQELAIKAESRETELQKQWTSALRQREEEWERQAQQRVRATETRFVQEAQQKEELVVARLRQRDEQWQIKLDAVQAELQTKAAAIEPVKAMLAQAERERDESKQFASDRVRQVQDLERKLTEASSFLNSWRNGKMGEAA